MLKYLNRFVSDILIFLTTKQNQIQIETEMKFYHNIFRPENYITKS